MVNEGALECEQNIIKITYNKLNSDNNYSYPHPAIFRVFNVRQLQLKINKIIIVYIQKVISTHLNMYWLAI